MKVIVGLGNPGKEYERTRHNVGFMLIHELAGRWMPGEIPKAKFNALVLDGMIGGEKVLLVRPMTFMNRSGQSVSEIMRFYQLEATDDLLVVVDDVALPLGDLRIRASGSAGSHNGLGDIQQRLGSRDYARLRVGIDEPSGRMNRVNFVLGKFSAEEQPGIEQAIRRSADACECWIRKGTTTTMNEFNTPRQRKSAESTEGEVE